MKKILSIVLIFLSLAARAQPNPDSIAYNLQRQKINLMLADRASKFGQYQQSLSKHTGIFGLQTKNDIRHSNDILMDINKTDDQIYAQVKILLQMTVFQSKQAMDKSTENTARAIETEKYNLSFMNAVNRLRTQNEQLKAQLDAAERTEVKTVVGFIVFILLIGGSIFYLNRDKYAMKR